MPRAKPQSEPRKKAGRKKLAREAYKLGASERAAVGASLDALRALANAHDLLAKTLADAIATISSLPPTDDRYRDRWALAEEVTEFLDHISAPLLTRLPPNAAQLPEVVMVEWSKAWASARRPRCTEWFRDQKSRGVPATGGPDDESLRALQQILRSRIPPVLEWTDPGSRPISDLRRRVLRALDTDGKQGPAVLADALLAGMMDLSPKTIQRAKPPKIRLGKVRVPRQIV